MHSIQAFFAAWHQKIGSLFSDKNYTYTLLGSALLLGLSIFLSLHLSQKNDVLFSSAPVEDLFFSLVPLLDLSWIFVITEIILIILAFLYGIFIVPEKLPFSLLAFSLFVGIRALCISLTHIGVPVDYIYPSMGSGDFFFHNDLFFSGHTGGPFLVALILWERKFWRYFLILISIIMAFTVLAMRLHYSIDIVGAYFITYGIFHIAEKIVHKCSLFQYSSYTSPLTK